MLQHYKIDLFLYKRLVIIAPDLTVSPRSLIIQFVVIGWLLIYVIRKREDFVAKTT